MCLRVQTVLAQVAPDQPLPLVISDRAMLSLATLAAYEAAGVRYLGPLPDSTLTATRSLSLIALLIGSGSGPELPMQVVQP